MNLYRAFKVNLKIKLIFRHCRVYFSMYRTGEKLEAFKAKHYFELNYVCPMMRGAIQIFSLISSIIIVFLSWGFTAFVYSLRIDSTLPPGKS